MDKQPTALAKLVDMCLLEIQEQKQARAEYREEYDVTNAMLCTERIMAIQWCINAVKAGFPYEREQMERMCILGQSEHDTGAMSDKVKQTATDYFTQNYIQDGE